MSDRIPADSVGIVSPQQLAITTPVTLLCGRVLSRMELTYETYGELNAARSNAVLVCHTHPGITTRPDITVATTNDPAGGILHRTRQTDRCEPLLRREPQQSRWLQRQYRTAFDQRDGRVCGPDLRPLQSATGWRRKRCSRALRIDRWAAVIGGSLGGMQAMQWAIDLPERVAHAVLILRHRDCPRRTSRSTRSSKDRVRPEFNGGRYLDTRTIRRAD
jgi:homoserine O-acetyltransferase